MFYLLNRIERSCGLVVCSLAYLVIPRSMVRPSVKVIGDVRKGIQSFVTKFIVTIPSRTPEGKVFSSGLRTYSYVAQ